MNVYTSHRLRDETRRLSNVLSEEFSRLTAEQEFTAILVGALESELSQAARAGEFA